MTDEPILTVIRLDPLNPSVQSDMRDVCRMHARVLSLLNLDPDQPKGRELWATPRPDRLLVQYHRAADARWLPDGYTVGHSVHQVRTAWECGDRVQWALIGCPIARRTTARPGGGRTVQVRAVEPAEWARARLSGLALDGVRSGQCQVRGVGSHRGGHGITHRRAHLTGDATVVDPEGVAAAIRGGVGRGRAHGCGLLMVGQAS